MKIIWLGAVVVLAGVSVLIWRATDRERQTPDPEPPEARVAQAPAEVAERIEARKVREVREEAGCEVRLDDLLGLYSYPGQIAIIVVYRGTVTAGEPHCLSESLEARTFADDGIPWSDLAFPSTAEALRDFLADEHDLAARGRSRNL